MSSNPYEVMMPQGPFGKAVDKAIAEINEQAHEHTEEDRLVAERWAAVMAAQEAAGPHAVVLMVAPAEEILKALRGEETTLPKDLLIRMVADLIQRAVE